MKTLIFVYCLSDRSTHYRYIKTTDIEETKKAILNELQYKYITFNNTIINTTHIINIYIEKGEDYETVV